MMFRYTHHGGVWVDLEHPTEEEIRSIAEEFSISERLEMELLSPTPTPLVANEMGMTFVVLHFPSHHAEGDGLHDQEVDFLIGSSFIITVRYEVVGSLHHLQKILQTQQLISRHAVLTTDALLETMFAHLYTSVRDYSNHISDRLTHIESDLFIGPEQKTVRAISDISREFLHMEAALANQEEPLNRFLRSLSTQEFFGTSFAERAERIRAEHTQVVRIITTHRAVATELRETNMALLETRQNEIMKTLTVITFGMLPLELIALVFGMHATGAPLEDNPNAFLIIVGSMIFIGACMTLFFSRKHWLS